MKLSRALALASGATALALGTGVAPAAAEPLERGHFHESVSELDEETCPGLTLRRDTETDGSFLVNPHGPDGLVYFMNANRTTTTLTNIANGKSLTVVFGGIVKDLKVTDNGDGTLTILSTSPGTRRWYGSDGEFLFNDSGLYQFEVLIDHGGTPTDPFDDVFLEFLGFVKIAGRGDTSGDICPLLV
jgi:hypothetical protein